MGWAGLAARRLPRARSVAARSNLAFFGSGSIMFSVLATYFALEGRAGTHAVLEIGTGVTRNQYSTARSTLLNAAEPEPRARSVPGVEREHRS
jgi:hypothetical protein